MTCQDTKTVKLSDTIIPKYYDSFNDWSIEHKIFTSGRAGTKSSRMAIKAIYTIVSDPDVAVVILRKFHNKLRKTVYKEVIRAINRLNLDKNDFKITASPMQITYLPYGNTIYFTGSDSIDDTKGMIDGLKPIKLVEIDELTEFFDKGEGEDELLNIEATFVRGNEEQFCMEYYFNPPKNQKSPIMQWVDKMVARKDCIWISTTYLDVPKHWLGSKLIASAEALKESDEKMYNWVWLGMCTGLDDIVYYMFNEENHIRDFPKEELMKLQYITIGVDYGQMNATTYQAFGMNLIEKKILGIGEYYHSGRETGYQKSPSEYATDFKNFVEGIFEKIGGKRGVSVYIDPSAKGLAEEIRRACPYVTIRNADNTVLLGINRCQKLLSNRVVFFCSEQKHLKEELYLYTWNMDLVDKGREEVIKANDHCMDAMRYAFMGMWRFVKQMLPLIAGKDD